MKVFEIVTSLKGCDFSGKKLTEDSLYADVSVVYKGHIYKTRNRYKNLVELFDGENIFTVKMNKIRLIKFK